MYREAYWRAVLSSDNYPEILEGELKKICGNLENISIT
jgi:hypothetical protein